MTNKYLNFLIFAVLLIGSGVVYQKFYRPQEIGAAEWNGHVINIPMRSLANQWKFEPDVIRAKKGDKIILDIFNEDTYDHGFAIEAFGVNNRLFPQRTTHIEFIASNAGEFDFYCSVACGEGHYSQTGKIIVEE